MKFNQETVSTIGLAKVVGGTINNPVEFIDLHLPANFMAFRLILSEFRMNAAPQRSDSVSIAFSQDGGKTFLNDTTNNDTYWAGQLAIINTDPTAQTATAFSNPGTGSLLGFGGLQEAAVADPGYVDITVFPGSDKSLSQIIGLQSNFDSIGLFSLANVFGGLYYAATTPPTKARITTIRLLPFGDGTANPPASGETIISGSYILLGIA